MKFDDKYPNAIPKHRCGILYKLPCTTVCANCFCVTTWTIYQYDQYHRARLGRSARIYAQSVCSEECLDALNETLSVLNTLTVTQFKLWKDKVRRQIDSAGKREKRSKGKLVIKRERIYFSDLMKKVAAWIQDPVCPYCKGNFDGAKTTDISFDHVLALSLDGKHSKDNLVLCCFDCNQKKAIEEKKECDRRRGK